MQVVLDVAWLPYQPIPQFLTCGADGLLLWSLQPTFLEQRLLVLPCATAMTVTAVCTATVDLEHDGQTLGAGSEAAATAAALAGDAEAAAALGAAAAAATEGLGLEGCRVTDPRYRQQQRQRREKAANTAWVADAAGGVWEVTISDGWLQQSSRVLKLLPGECATALTWSQGAAAVAVATDQGRVLRYSLRGAAGAMEEGIGRRAGGMGSSSNAGLVPAGATAGSLSAGTGAVAGSAGGQPVAEAGAAAGGDAPFWAAASPLAHLIAELLLDGPCAALQLDPGTLQEGVVVSSSCTCWFIDLARQEKVPLLWSHPTAVTGMVAVQQQQLQLQHHQQLGQGEQQQQELVQGRSVVISTAQDGVLRVWSVGQGQVSLREG